MTKKELAAIHGVTGSYEDYRQHRDEVFTILQEELTQRGLKPSCSLQGNFRELALLGAKEMDRALVLMHRYWDADSKMHIIMNLGLNLANVANKPFDLGCPKYNLGVAK